MTVQLPVVQEGPHFSFNCELDGVTYGFSFRWNDRDSAWFLDIADGGGTPMLSGIRVVINLLLLRAIRGVSGLALPPGDLIALDTTGQGLDAAFEDLGRRVQILYLTQAEITAAAIATG
jgi:hypothetical protein